MRKGILRDFVWSWVSGLGHVAIEDCETHKLEMVLYEDRPTIEKYKGRVIYWECDEFGMLAKVEPVKDS